MEGFIPQGFWSTLALMGMAVFFVFGVDLIFGAKLIRSVNHMVNKRFHVDQAIVNALADLKKKSDREFDVDQSLTQGWGRFVMSGLLFFGAAMLLLNVIPLFK